MILRNATIQYKGYDPEDLGQSSKKRICCSCDQCGKVRWIQKGGYRDLCTSCSRKGKNNGFYGKHHNKETCKQMSKNHADFRGKNSNLYGKKHSDETKRKQSKSMKGYHPSLELRIKTSCTNQGISREEWRGFIKQNNRTYILSEAQCLKINTRFKGSHGHHISTDVIVYIPEKLHRHIPHNIKNNQGMSEMNLLSLQYIRGWL